MALTDPSLKIPEALREHTDRIRALTDPFCTEYLDSEYAELVHKLVAKLARKRPSPLLRGELRVWGAAAIHVIGSVNFLWDRTQTPHLTVEQLSGATGVPKSTLAGKAKLIRDTLGIGMMEPEFCRRALLESHPLMAFATMGGFIVDTRSATGRGGEDLGDEDLDDGELDTDERDALDEAADDVIGILRRWPSPVNAHPDAWTHVIDVLIRKSGLPPREVRIIESAVAKVYDGWSNERRRVIWVAAEDLGPDLAVDMEIEDAAVALRTAVADAVIWAAREMAEVVLAARP